MKKLLIALATVMLTAASYGQGQVVFVNRVANLFDAPVFTCPPQGPGPEYTAQLYLAGPGGALTALTPTSTFRPAGTGAAAIADRYWISQDVVVPGIAPGASATFVARAWRTFYGDFFTARSAGAAGESAPFTVTVGGGLLPPANLTTLQSFTMCIPEPGTIALGVLGVVALVLRRRR